jgi:glucose/arabinose dehydrogenase
MKTFSRWTAVALLVSVPSLASRAADAPAGGPSGPKAPAKPTKGAVMDYGPFLSSSLALPLAGGKQQVVAYKSLSVKLAEGAHVAFDTELMRYAAGWSGGWLDLSKTHMTSSKGSVCPDVAGRIAFTTKLSPGVSSKGSLDDPRNDPRFPRRGPLPKAHAHYKGLYLHGDRVVIAYTAGGGELLELPGAAKAGEATVFTRTIRVERTTEPLTLVLADDAAGLAAEVSGAGGATVANEGGSLRVTLPASAQAAVYRVVLGPAAAVKQAASLPAMVDPVTLTKGGPARWKQAIQVKGELAVNPKADAGEPPPAYVVDTLPLPEENPWSAWVRPAGFDFFADGNSAALCTWNGDVWVVSGIDEKLENLSWRRFATGLYEPLGLKVVDGAVYALGRDQITRLRDLDGDGEADFYENFNNDGPTGDNYHLFKYDLHTDAAGNFYYAVTGAWAPNELFHGHSTICKVSADGSKLEYVGRGFRAPNGMAVGPAGEIVVSDNQGHWTPTSKISYLPPGKADGFYGFPFDPRIEKTFDVKRAYPRGVPTAYEPPLCWVPYRLDTSSGGQAFVTSDKWGPFGGNILHTSYGTSGLFMVMPEIAGGVAQGGLWRMPLAFEGGIMRLRFNPADGQLYVAGMRGWQTNSAKDGCLQRVRYTGKLAYQPKALRATTAGLYVTFTDPIDPASATDVGAYDVEQWQYRWSKEYGSPDYSVENPTKKGRDTVEVKSAKLQADGRTVFLEMPAIRPVMQMGVTYKLKGADGREVSGAIYNTINRLGAP